MACHCLFYKNEKEFFTSLENNEKDLIIKITKCVINAIKRKKKRVEVFEVFFKNGNQLLFSVDEKEYPHTLQNCMKQLITYEEYELCAVIKKIVDKKLSLLS